jgi:hypothetical protein
MSKNFPEPIAAKLTTILNKNGVKASYKRINHLNPSMVEICAEVSGSYLHTLAVFHKLIAPKNNRDRRILERESL